MIELIMGIDPGLTGAVALLDKANLKCIALEDMPTMPLSKNKLQVNPVKLADYIDFIGENGTVYIEKVAAMPQQGTASMFNFGVSYGIIQGICGALHHPFVLVSPPRWKKVAGLIGKPKDAARTLAQQLYPDVDLSLKKHIGRADALLIARFGWLS